MSCKGICHTIKAKRPESYHRYAEGQKRCNHCEVYLDHPGNHCPCCGYRIRIRPRARRYLREVVRY